jgi:hypothetical protein
MNQTAYLSNRGEYTTFSVGDRTITFLTSKNLEDNKGRSFCVCPHVYVKMGTDTKGPSPFSWPGKTEDCTLVAKMI